jgi:hypothetical protein
MTPSPDLNELALYGYTYIRADGNRFAAGQGNIPQLRAMDIPLEGPPAWIVSGPVEGNGSIWVAVLEDGRVQAFMLRGSRLTPLDLSPANLPPGAPTSLIIDRGVPSLVIAPSPQASPATHPVVLTGSHARMAFIENSGDLVLWEGGETGRLALNALPDARILRDENNRLLLFTAATRRYTHGVLGDDLEAGSLSLVETSPGLSLVWQVAFAPDKVAEGIATIWVDLNGDGSREILVTVSDAQSGAQLLLFNDQGIQVAAGPAVGRGFRWRHQLAAAPFLGPGEWLLADVLTPHIGGSVEFYRWSQDRLEIVAQIPGFSTHRLGSRNLDMALAADLDMDGNVELLVPTQDMKALSALRLVNGSLLVAWEIELGARIASNLSAVTLEDGRIALGVGLQDARLRIWSP